MQVYQVPVNQIYVPVQRRKTLDENKVNSLAEDIMENGQLRPIQIRKGKDRFVLVEGYHRLQACIALGEEKIQSYLVQAKKF